MQKENSSSGTIGRTSEEMKVVWAERPKCTNHPRSLPTKNSVEKGYPLCYFCDPDYKERKEKEKQAGKKLGTREAAMPDSLVESYSNAVRDDRTIELREDIATTEARLQHILASIRDNPMESASFITMFNKQYKKQHNLVKRGQQTYPKMMEELDAMLNGKVSEIMAYQEFYRVTDMKRKLVEAETSRIAKLGWTPAYVQLLILCMTRILKDMLPREQMIEFQGRLSQDPIFKSKTFQLTPRREDVDDYISTEEVDGTFEVADPR